MSRKFSASARSVPVTAHVAYDESGNTPSLSEAVMSGSVQAAEKAGVSRSAFRRRFLANRAAVVALGLLLFIVATAVLAPVLAPHDPSAISISSRLQAPSSEHWLGTDDLGRDLLSRLLFASRNSLMAAVIAVVIAFSLGTPFGLLAGYLGGIWDTLMSRFADIVISLPTLIIAIGIIAATGPGLVNAMAAIGFVYSPRVFRVVRGATLGVRNETYIEASVAGGASTYRIVRRHILPNVRSPLIVQLSLLMAFALLAEASLSFLGLGTVPPDASWGQMLGRAFRDINVAPYQIYWPGIAIAVTTLAFNVLGDGLRDAFGREIRDGK